MSLFDPFPGIKTSLNISYGIMAYVNQFSIATLNVNIDLEPAKKGTGSTTL